jgi:hypothetical protein
MESDVAKFDPMQTIDAYADTECSIQLLLPDAKVFHCSSIGEALTYASENGGKWNGVELTVHRDREDIVYGTDKTRMLIVAFEHAAKEGRPRRRASDTQ